MGIIWSRFKGKLSTKEVLEGIEKDLKSADDFLRGTLERKSGVTRRLLVITVLVYLLAVAVYFLFPPVQRLKLYFYGGLFAFAILIWLFHKFLKWHYSRQARITSEKALELKKRKQKILEEVMDTETYKVAKEILDKFGDKAMVKPPELKLVPSTPVPAPRPSLETELRQRRTDTKQPAQIREAAPVMNTPTPSQTGTVFKFPQQVQSVQRMGPVSYGHAPMRPLPRPILPRERGIIDRVMDFFVGDGPNRRYALICRHCGGHNGMALQEEFEYVSYYCCYCYQFNPPRKHRPTGPRLPIAAPPATPAPPVSPTPSKQSSVGKTEDKVTDKSEDRTSDESESEAEYDTSSHEDQAEQKDEEASSEKMEVDAQDETNSISDDAGLR